MTRSAPAGANILVWLLLAPLLLTFYVLYVCVWLVFGCVWLFIVLPLTLLFGTTGGGDGMSDREY